MEEKFIPVIGYENKYKISILGNVISLSREVTNSYRTVLTKERLLKHRKTSNGYLYVSLYKNGKYKNFSVHRLLAVHFIPNPENKRCVNHINGIKTDNKVENLEWVTHSENMNHAVKSGLHRNTSKRVNQYNQDGLLLNTFNSAKEAVDYINKNTNKNYTSSSSISNCCKGRDKTAYGFKWEYAEEVKSNG